MSPRLAFWTFGAIFGQLALSAVAQAQSCSRAFGPLQGEFRISQASYFDQIWPQPARGANGWTFAWSQGQDVWARRYDLQLNPIGGQFQVNTTYNLGIQDEPAISYGTTGNFLVAWSDRNAYDGSGMSVFARVYGPDGNPIIGEFVVNTIRAGSQWRPLITPTPSGGWVVAWSGDSDGNAYFKILSQHGALLSGDILVNTYTFDAQVDPAAAVAPNGTIFIVFVDYSGQAGAGLDLYGRTFNAAGVPLQAQEFPIRSTTLLGHQKDPRVAADGAGRFYVTWEDQFGDGAGWGILARVFNSAGAPLVPEFVVNSTTASDQRQPRLAVDSIGRSLIAWVDFSSGFANAKIRARRFSGQAQPWGADFVVNENPVAGVSTPAVAMDSSGGDAIIGFQGPGAAGDGVDVWGVRFASTVGPHVYCTAKVNSQGCLPTIGFSGNASASAASPFSITATNVLNQKPGFLLYGFGSSFAPYYGSKICIAPPLKSTPFQSTGGSPAPANNCSGSLSIDFNARIQSGIDPLLVPGTTIGARWYYRDAQDPAGYGTGLTNAVRFTICP
ncbi:MAG: hypothetical protein ACKVXR_11240 [Planctomycetota bacterium]